MTSPDRPQRPDPPAGRRTTPRRTRTDWHVATYGADRETGQQRQETAVITARGRSDAETRALAKARLTLIDPRIVEMRPLRPEL